MSAATEKRQGILEIIERGVLNYPDAVAIESCDSGRTSYRELWKQAMSIAQHLQLKQEVGEGDLVALDMPKSAEFVTGLLACWMAGAAALILDPEWPKERRQFVLNEAKPVFVLDTEKVRNVNNAMVDPGTQWTLNCDPSSLAYVIYTSGSSGKPKGALVTHAGLPNVLNQQVAMFRLENGSRSLWVHHVAFDASLSDIGTALTSGATLCIDPEINKLSPAEFLERVGERNITHIDLPPSLLRFLDPTQAPACLQVVIIGGEVCPPEVVRRWASRVRVVIVYGPTEATICTGMVLCSDDWESACIGEPIEGIEYEIEGGDTGELLIHGNGVALGYINRQDLSQSRFGENEGRRFFRSGDLVRRNTDHGYEFVGRVDRQVKLNGKLVCPEEIEQVLESILGVTAAAVERIENEGRAVLRAIIESEEILLTETIRNIAGRDLSPWMVPNVILTVRKLPRLKNGKIDRSMLEGLARKEEKQKPEKQGSVFGTNLDEDVAGLFKKILGVPSVRITDDFFQIGGDSLGVLALLSKSEEVGIPLTAAMVWENRTPLAIAAEINIRGGGTAAMGIDQLRREVEQRKASRVPGGVGVHRKPEALSKIFMTGATGFLGSAIVGDLLEQTSSDIWCLVRGDSDSELKRIASAARSHGHLIGKSELNRIHCFRGDLEKEFFGWSRQQWLEYSEQFDLAVHCGAATGLTSSFDMLKAANVGGTRTMLDFIEASGGRTALHYVSTLSVFVDANPVPAVCLESDNADNPEAVYGGYAQSKWVAEQTVLEAADAGWPVTVYRCGLLTGNSVSGLVPEQDWLSIYLDEMSRHPDSLSVESSALAFDFTPVDYAASAITHLMIGDHNGTLTRQTVFHIANPQPLTLADLRAAVGRLESESEDVENYDGPNVELAQIRLAGVSSFERHRPFDLFKATGTQFSIERTRLALEGSEIVCPAPDLDYLTKYIHNLQSNRRK